MDKQGRYKGRNSSIELLKILAVIIIIISHSIPTYGGYDVGVSKIGFQHILYQLATFAGQLGNIIFVLCSAYFLHNSKKVKLYKIMELLLDALVVIFAFTFIYFIKERFFSATYLLYRLYLVLVGNEFGFLGTYLIFYLIHPLLNYIVKNLSKSKHLLVCIIYLALYSVSSILVWFVFGTTSAYKGMCGGSSLLCFAGLYFLVTYVKLYGNDYRNNIKLNAFILLIAVIILVLIIIFANFLGIKISKYSYGVNIFNGTHSFVLTFIAISLFNLFSRKEFVCKPINVISSLSLFVYVFSENYFTKKIKNRFFKWVFKNYSQNTYLLWCLALIVGTIIVSFVVGIIYKYTLKKALSKINYKFCGFVEDKGKRLLTKSTNK